MLRYLAGLTSSKIILWCYSLWYLVIFFKYFEADPALWLTSFGLSLIVGFALYTNAASAGAVKVKPDFWQAFRFYLTPFCVSSFSALVKGRGFFLVFSPQVPDLVCCFGVCALFCLATVLAKRAGFKTDKSL